MLFRSRDQLFALSEFDYDPAQSLDDLRDRSDVVIVAEVVKVSDGARFLADNSESTAMRFLRLTFRSESTGEFYPVDLPRPRNISWTAARDALPIGSRAVIYLVDVLPRMTTDEKKFWRGLPADHYWQFATPQGFVLGVDGHPWYQPQVTKEPGRVAPEKDRPSAWLPTTGEKGLDEGSGDG